jgi:hypothetical protein
MSATESAEIDKKVQEIERGVRTEENDEDDAGKKQYTIVFLIIIILLGVKRPSESQNLDDNNSNIKTNRSNRNDFRYDAEYNPSK